MLYVGLTNLFFLLRYSLARQPVLRNHIYFLTLLFLFLFSAFRYRVGCDWTGYYFQFQRAEAVDWTFILANSEPIWWYILKLTQNFNLPYPTINVISSIIFFLGIHVLSKRQPDPFAFLIIIFPILIINMPMSGIRQGAAIGVFCIALLYFLDRRPILFALWVLIASGLHSSAMIFLLLTPLTLGKYSRKRIILAILLSIPGALILATSGSAEMASSRYINAGIESAGAIFRVSALLLTALYFFFFMKNKWSSHYPEDFSLAHIGSIAMMLSVLLLPISSVIADRFGYYLIPIQALIFARLPFLPFQKSQAMYSALPYIGLSLIFTVWSLSSWHFQQCYVPYNTWIFGFPSRSQSGF